MNNYKQLISKMKFEEKAALLTGSAALSTYQNDKLGISQLSLSDGPHGVRRLIGHSVYPQECSIEGGNVCYPTASAIGATWNVQIARKTGASVALDCIKEGIDVLLAPAVNMKRVPNCGRNFEYYSEDPVLSGMLAAEFINGVQENGIGTSLKHFAANNQEIDRGTINVEIDERTLREYYLKVFEIVIKNSNPTSVMCAYNKLNGIWCSENKYLLNDILREEWKYDGLVISDWGAVHNIGKALAAGLDLQMPKNKNIASQLEKCLDNKTVTVGDIDRAAEAVLRFIEQVKNLRKSKSEYNRHSLHQAAYDAAAEAITLLKNDDDVLPVTKQKYKKIAVMGKAAKYPMFMGGGSSCVTVDKTSVDIPLDFINENAGDDIQVTYCPYFEYEGDFFEKSDNKELHDTENANIKEAAQNSDLCIIFVSDENETETEEVDRQSVMFPNYVNYSINLAQSLCENVVVVMQTGAAAIPRLWHNKVKGIVQMWYAGEAGGSAIADVLFGKINPSGKLSESFMIKERADLDYPGDGTKACYDERMNVGYHYYDIHKDEIWYPFGHGLSYTTFEYSDIKVDKENINAKNFSVNVSAKIANTGKIAGKEVVQLYLQPLDSVVSRPLKELKHFAKIEIGAGDVNEVNFTLSEDDFAYFNVCMRKWHVESGEYKILIASSSQDIRLSKTVWVCIDDDYTKEIKGGAMVL